MRLCSFDPQTWLLESRTRKHGSWRVRISKGGHNNRAFRGRAFPLKSTEAMSATTNVAELNGVILLAPPARRHVSAGGRRAKLPRRDGIRAEMHPIISSFPLQEHRNGPNLPGICMRPSVRGLEGVPKRSVTAPLGTKPALQRETGGRVITVLKYLEMRYLKRPCFREVIDLGRDWNSQPPRHAKVF